MPVGLERFKNGRQYPNSIVFYNLSPFSLTQSREERAGLSSCLVATSLIPRIGGLPGPLDLTLQTSKLLFFFSSSSANCCQVSVGKAAEVPKYNAFEKGDLFHPSRGARNVVSGFHGASFVPHYQERSKCLWFIIFFKKSSWHP